MENRSHHSAYAANIDHLDIELADGDFRVELQTRQTPADLFTGIWEEA